MHSLLESVTKHRKIKKNLLCVIILTVGGSKPTRGVFQHHITLNYQGNSNRLRII